MGGLPKIRGRPGPCINDSGSDFESSILELEAFTGGFGFFVLNWRERCRVQEIRTNAIFDRQAWVRGGQQLDFVIYLYRCS